MQQPDDETAGGALPDEAKEAELSAALDGYLHASANGSPLDRERWIAANPAIAEPLRERLGALEFLTGAFARAGAAAGPASGDSFGDYRIVRELGRGGQGAVYLAEHTQSRREVALKCLLRLGPGADVQLRRFRREAEVAARLQHPGICAVHATGMTDGVPFISMPYVDGEPLSARIARRRCAGLGEPPSTSHGTSQRTPWSRGELEPLLHLFEKAARALHAAHEAGILHRDVKPGNIMITPQGEPVILDFGLARLEEDVAGGPGTSLTQTGDLFGTPAYMSPEQIAGHRHRVDRRSDVYSLGVSLYECVTLERPFDEPTREALYRAILTRAPYDPRKLNRAISDDLRVVLDTALEKDRDRRYQTAQAFADDLRAVSEGLPIRARRIGTFGRGARWSRREPAKAALLLALLVSFPIIAALVTSHIQDRPHVEAARLARITEEREALLAEASSAMTEGKARAATLFEQVLRMEGSSPEAVAGLVVAKIRLAKADEALGLLDRHASLLGDGAATRVCRAQALTRLGRTDDARALLAGAPPALSAFDHEVLAMNALADCGSLDAESLHRALRHATAAMMLSPSPRLALHEHRAHAAAHLRERQTVLDTVAAIRSLWPHSPIALRCAGRALWKLDEPDLFDEALACFREAVRLRPDARDCHYVGEILMKKGLLDEAVTAYRQAIGLSQRWPDAYVGLGSALHRKGQLDDAIAALREAIRLPPALAVAHFALGSVLESKGLHDDAVVAYGEAIGLNNAYAEAHCNRASIWYERGQLDDAIAGYRAAIQAKGDLAVAHYNLGVALAAKGMLDEAITSQREALRLDPGYGAAHHRLAIALHRQGLLDRALTAYRDAARLLPDAAEVHNDLAVALSSAGRLEEAAAAARTVLRLQPDRARGHYNLGVALEGLGFLDDALAGYRRAIELDQDLAEPWINIGGCMSDCGRFRDALDCYRRAEAMGAKRAVWLYPTARLVAEAERRVAREETLEQRLAAHLAAGTEPERPRELLALARIALGQQRTELATRWYGKALDDPDAAQELEGSHRRDAAGAALLMASAKEGGAATLDEARATWRGRALRWLQAELQHVQAGYEAGTLGARAVRGALVPLVRSGTFTPVRDPESLAALPETERDSWRRLWTALDALLQKLERDGKQAAAASQPSPDHK